MANQLIGRSIGFFFKAVRAVVGPLVLLGDRLTAPKGLVRSPDAQARVELELAGLAIYQFEACPFCVKVRRELRRLGLPIELRDVRRDARFRAELLQGGGDLQVPCLRIESPGQTTRWMYESDAIIAYLRGRFAS